MEEDNEKELRQAFFEILKGCTPATIKVPKNSLLYINECPEINVFVKHLNLADQIDLDQKYNQAFSKAKKNGLPTKEENLDFLEKSGQWKKTDEGEWGQTKSYLESLRKTKAKLVVPSQQDAVQKQIEDQEKKFAKLDGQRTSMLGQTCETYARSFINSYTICNSFYADQELQNRFLSEEDLEYLDNSDISVLVNGYNEAVAPITIEKVKKLSISSFFTSYYALCEKQPYVIFSRGVADLSFYQLNLLTYAKVLRSIIRNTEPPEEMMKDPDKLIEWSEKGEKQRKMMEKAHSDKKDAFSVVGAEKDDYKKMGVKRAGKSIFDLAGEKGELGLMDFISD